MKRQQTCRKKQQKQKLQMPKTSKIEEKQIFKKLNPHASISTLCLLIYLLYDVHYAAKSEAKLGGFSKLLNSNKDYVIKFFRNKA